MKALGLFGAALPKLRRSEISEGMNGRGLQMELNYAVGSVSSSALGRSLILVLGWSSDLDQLELGFHGVYSVH